MIQTKIKELLDIVNSLQKIYPHKKFTLDGRLVGDIGEILAEQHYCLKVFDKVKPDYDAETEHDKRNVQIKATMKNSVWYPRDKHPERFLAIEITAEGEIKELYNGETKPFVEYLATRKRNNNYNYYTITKGILLKLNEQVDAKTRIKRRK